jgi:iron(III) transport system substrate-binding protein
MKEGKPVTMIYPDQDGAGTLIVPNAAVLVANGPNAENGNKFIEYLNTASVEQALAESEAAQMPLRPAVPVPAGVQRVEEIRALAVDYEKLGARLETLAAEFLRAWAAQ